MNEELKIIITAETAKLQQACNQATQEVEKLGKTTSTHGHKIGEVFKKAGKVALDASKAIAKGVGLASGALVGLTVKAVKSAGELEQNIGGSKQVFQEYANDIQGYAKEAYKNLGLSTSEYLATANKMGALLQGSGFTIQESLDLTSKAMQRAGDVASIMGIDTADAMEAITGACKGNFTMMDNLGVAMNATTLEAYALSKGIEKSWNEMSNQEKEALALEMFLDKTTYATGNYAKENETLAGALNTAKSAFKNFLDGSGSVEQFVEAFSNAGEVILQNVMDIAPRIMEGVSGILEGIMPMIPQFIEQLTPVILDGAIGLMNSLVEIMPQLVETLVGSLPILLEGITQIIQGILESIQASLPSIITAVATLIPQICSSIATLLPSLISLGIQIIVALLQGISQSLPQVLSTVVSLIPTIINSFLDAIPDLLDAGVEFLTALVDAIPEFLPDLIAELPTIIQSILSAVLNNIPTLLQAGVQLFLALVMAIPQFLPDLIDMLPEIIDTIVSTLIDSAPQLLMAGVEIFMEIVKSIPKIIPALLQGLADIISKLKTHLVDKAKSIMNFDWHFPKLKLPHFSIQGSFSLSPPSVPHLAVNWYANGGVFDKPTLFPYGGNIGGLGEAGAEAIVPLEKNTKWLDRMATMLAEKSGSGAPIILQVDGKVFGEIAVDSINDLTRMRGSLPLRLV